MFEANQTHVFRNIAPMLAQAFPSAERQFMRSGQNRGTWPALIEDVGYGGLAVFEFVVRERDGVDMLIKAKFLRGAHVSSQPVAMPLPGRVPDIPDMAVTQLAQISNRVEAALLIVVLRCMSGAAASRLARQVDSRAEHTSGHSGRERRACWRESCPTGLHS